MNDNEKPLDTEELRMVIQVLTDDIKIWINTKEGMIQVTDYDYDLDNNRLILK